MAQEIYGWEIMQWNVKEDVILVGEYKKAGWNKKWDGTLDWEMKHFDKGAKYQYLLEKK